MFKLKSKLMVAVMVMFGITAFMSCDKQEEVINSEQDIEKKIFEENAELVEQYKNEVASLKSTKNEDSEIFLQYFLNYQVIINGSANQIGDYMLDNDVDVLEFFNLFIEKREYLLNPETNKNVMAPPTDAEIRDALMKECEEFFILEYPCKAAVEIAYLIR